MSLRRHPARPRPLGRRWVFWWAPLPPTRCRRRARPQGAQQGAGRRERTARVHRLRACSGRGGERAARRGGGLRGGGGRADGLGGGGQGAARLLLAAVRARQLRGRCLARAGGGRFLEGVPGAPRPANRARAQAADVRRRGRRAGCLQGSAHGRAARPARAAASACGLPWSLRWLRLPAAGGGLRAGVCPRRSLSLRALPAVALKSSLVSEMPNT
mmetsp:Transcript_19416/g.45709  ORF Transcript_19416/g.45709 Transcript_19416/m.45709 type:complete len:215 (+) Transcript_19416:1325-1969(+)